MALRTGQFTSRNPIRYLNDGVSQALKTASDGSRPRIVFATERGKGVFLPRPHMPPAETPSEDFPFVLNNGRLQHQWHTLTKTGKIATLNKLNPGPFIEIHPEDAAALGICDKNRVEVRSRRGRALLPAVVTDRVRPGNCFAPFHWNDEFGEELAINAVTSDSVDPISLQPEFKFSAVALTRIPEEFSSTVTTSDEKGGLGSRPAAELLSDSEELDTMQIDAFARFLGLDPASSITLEAHERLYLQGYLLGLNSEEGRKLGGVPTLPTTAPLELNKRLVLDGVLAGLFARAWVPTGVSARAVLPVPQASVNASSESLVFIVWASQTGNAERFAAECAEKLRLRVALSECLAWRASKWTTLPRLALSWRSPALSVMGIHPTMGSRSGAPCRKIALQCLKMCTSRCSRLATPTMTNSAALAVNWTRVWKRWARTGSLRGWIANRSLRGRPGNGYKR